MCSCVTRVLRSTPGGPTGSIARKDRSRKRLPPRDRVPLDAAGRPNQRWSLYFVSDALWNYRRFRVLNIVDDRTRESPGRIVDFSISGKRLARYLDELAAIHGYPEEPVHDNGQELTSRAMFEWSQRTGVRLRFIQPGKPTRNAYVESFMYRRPRGRKCFESDVDRRVRSCIRPVCAVLT